MRRTRTTDGICQSRQNHRQKYAEGAIRIRCQLPTRHKGKHVGPSGQVWEPGTRKWRRLDSKKNRLEYNARNQLYRAVRKGLLVRSPFCQLCLVGGLMDGHHEDYRKCYEVVWLCRKCHMKLEWLKGKFASLSLREEQGNG